ncbi:MAG: tagatose-6-phosphate ketose isomerase, partial [Acidobacteriales bacterium]|nr:tagatose-6-phosphate ketose isomerase [Terriglobales bacterium]
MRPGSLPTINSSRPGSGEVSALATLLNATSEEKVARGMVHTPAEIAQQPATWSQTYEIFQQRQTEIRDFLRRAGIVSPQNTAPTVLLIGAGTSDYVGRSLVNLLRRQWDCDVVACPSTDLITQLQDVLRPRRQYLCISFSRSGDSPEGVAVLDRILRSRADIHHLVVTCNRDGRMIRQAEDGGRALGICLDDSVNDRGLAMTSSFSNMVVLGQCLAHIYQPEQYSEILSHLVEAGSSFLPLAANRAAELAEGGYKKACFVGSGSLSAVAQESALKLLEMTAGKVFTMSASTVGLRHGPMAALDH